MKHEEQDETDRHDGNAMNLDNIMEEKFLVMALLECA